MSETERTTITRLDYIKAFDWRAAALRWAAHVTLGYAICQLRAGKSPSVRFADAAWAVALVDDELGVHELVSLRDRSGELIWQLSTEDADPDDKVLGAFLAHIDEVWNRFLELWPIVTRIDEAGWDFLPAGGEHFEDQHVGEHPEYGFLRRAVVIDLNAMLARVLTHMEANDGPDKPAS